MDVSRFRLRLRNKEFLFYPETTRQKNQIKNSILYVYTQKPSSGKNSSQFEDTTELVILWLSHVERFVRDDRFSAAIEQR